MGLTIIWTAVVAFIAFKIADVIVGLRQVTSPSDPILGDTHYTVGLISGGVAPNVVPPHAEAEVMFRTVGAHEGVRQRLIETVAGRVEVEDIAVVPPSTGDFSSTTTRAPSTDAASAAARPAAPEPTTITSQSRSREARSATAGP